MIHSDEQNEPFCDVKRAILKNRKKNIQFLSDSFTKATVSVFVA